MNIIIPMAGRGSRLRPHTLTVPKPLIPIAGKPIVQRLVEDIVRVCEDPVEEIAFIIGDFGEEVESDLLKIASSLGAKGRICYQTEPLGTAHAILCAADSLKDHVIIAFADTLFKADFRVDTNQDGTIWVKKIEDPSSFGVVKLNENNQITEFVEKPETYVSDLAIIGIYYFKDGEYLRKELQYLMDNDIKEKGEYQLTNALENMKGKGAVFSPAEVSEWLDCGNKNATIYTNERILEFNKDKNLVDDSAHLKDSIIIKPCFIGKDVQITNSVIGPYVSVENGTSIESCVVKNSMIQSHSIISGKILNNSMIGNHCMLKGDEEDLSLGDYSSQK